MVHLLQYVYICYTCCYKVCIYGTPSVSYVLSRQLVTHWKFCYNSSVVPVQDYLVPVLLR